MARIVRMCVVALTCVTIVVVSGAWLRDTTTQASIRSATELYVPFLASANDPTLPTVTPTPGPVTIAFFDANTMDHDTGPNSWDSNYGKWPEIIVAPDGTSMTVLAQNYGENAYGIMLQLDPDGSGGYEVTQMLTRLPMLERVMGLAVDNAGNRYYATSVDEDAEVNGTYPPIETARTNIVRVVKIDSLGNTVFNIDLDIARRASDTDAEQIVNPMVAGTGRLLVGGNELALVHAINTEPDPSIGDERHQKALSTRINATTGAIMHSSDLWVSHSFDHRLLYDGSGIIELHLGDAYPRTVVMGDYDHDDDGHDLFHIKGSIGDNDTFTRLGNAALIESDATYRYLVLFASETTTTTSGILSGPRNLAIVRASRTNFAVDPNLPDVLTVTSGSQSRTNRLRWLTSYSAGSNLHAERPKLVPIGGDEYIVLWEQWQVVGTTETFQGVYGMRIDATGSILAPATLLTAAHHLQRGDDAFRLGTTAAWMTADTSGQDRLYLHTVDAALTYTMTTIDVPAP